MFLAARARVAVAFLTAKARVDIVLLARVDVVLLASVDVVLLATRATVDVKTFTSLYAVLGAGLSSLS